MLIIPRKTGVSRSLRESRRRYEYFHHLPSQPNNTTLLSLKSGNGDCRCLTTFDLLKNMSTQIKIRQQR